MAKRPELQPLRVGVVGPHGEEVGRGVDLRFGGVDHGPEGLVAPLDREGQGGARADLVGVAFGDVEVDLERGDPRQFGHDNARRGVGSLADVAQSDHAVEGGAQLRESDVRPDDGDVGVEDRQFGTGLLVGLLADGVLLEQGALAVDAVLGQLELCLVARQLRLQRPVIDLGQQVALADGGAFAEVDFHDLAGGLEREVYLLVRQQVADDRDGVGEGLRPQDEAIDVEDLFLSRCNGGFGRGDRAVGLAVAVIEPQTATEYEQYRAGDDPFLFSVFVHGGAYRFGFWDSETNIRKKTCWPKGKCSFGIKKSIFGNSRTACGTARRHARGGLSGPCCGAWFARCGMQLWNNSP